MKIIFVLLLIWQFAAAQSEPDSLALSKYVGTFQSGSSTFTTSINNNQLTLMVYDELYALTFQSGHSFQLPLSGEQFTFNLNTSEEAESLTIQSAQSTIVAIKL